MTKPTGNHERTPKKRGPGRPKEPDSGVSHLSRAAIDPRYPVYITLRLTESLPSLLGETEFDVFLSVLELSCEAEGFRVIEYGAMDHEIRLLVEADDRKLLSKAMQGMGVRVSKSLNKLWDRKGSVYSDRFEERVLKTPQDVRAALLCVVGSKAPDTIEEPAPDAYSSGRWFTGWTIQLSEDPLPKPPFLSDPQSKLLAEDWKQFGLLDPQENPNPVMLEP